MTYVGSGVRWSHMTREGGVLDDYIIMPWECEMFQHDGVFPNPVDIIRLYQ